MTAYLNELGLLCSLGDTPEEVGRAMLAGKTPLNLDHDYDLPRPLYVGDVKSELPRVADDQVFETRSNQLLLAAVNQIAPALDRMRGGTDPRRIGVVIGTSTSGIREGEFAVAREMKSGKPDPQYHYHQQLIGNCARFLANHVGAEGVALTISTACSSSGNALATAARLLASDRCDVVIAGGVDSLCGMTLQGFSALEAVSAGLANPFAAGRDGINLGEGAALFLMSRQPGPVALVGYGASSDAHHISAPHPEGKGAEAAIVSALKLAGLHPEQIDYVNLHGTGTPLNDLVESNVINRVFGEKTACSSSKALTGHTLGAAAAIEAGLCFISMTRNLGRVPHYWEGPYDPELPPIHLVTEPEATPDVCLSNSFAFGGNNIALILGRVA